MFSWKKARREAFIGGFITDKVNLRIRVTNESGQNRCPPCAGGFIYLKANPAEPVNQAKS